MKADAARQERGQRFWTVEHLTSAPFLLTASTVCLCVLGLVMVFSASSISLVESGDPAWDEFFSQAKYMLVSLLALLFLRVFGTRIWLSNAGFYVVLAFIYALLVLVLFKGTDSHGATRWIYIAGMSLQPSEFAKIVVVMGAARVLTKWEAQRVWNGRLLFEALLFIAVPFGLIFAQKDLGTLLIIGASIFLMAILAGARPRTMFFLFLGACGLVLAAILTSDYRRDRFSIWFDPYSDYYGDGWQLIHGAYAFASGGFFGLGLGNSRQKYAYLPEPGNDYVFAIIGEELGFLGAFSVILLFVLWGWSGMRIAYQARGRNRACSLGASGLTILILVQALLNMGGVLGVMPLSGRTLPFISSGGSSVLSCLAIVGLLLGVARDNELALSGERAAGQPRGRADRSHLTVLDGGQARPEGDAGARPRSRAGEGTRPGADRPSASSGRAAAPRGRTSGATSRPVRDGDPAPRQRDARPDARPRPTRYDSTRDGAERVPDDERARRTERASRDGRGRR